MPAGADRGDAETDKLAEFGLVQLFEDAAERGQKAVAIFSNTDREMKRKQSFGTKEEEYVWNSALSDEPTCRAWVESMSLAFKCHKGMKPESPNQDSFSIVVVEGDFALYSVFDGHGPNGHDVSDFARGHVVKGFLELRQGGVEDAFRQSFLATQKVFTERTEDQTLDSGMSGTTCTVAYHDIPGNKLYIGHVGDSRAIISNEVTSKEAEDLTVDHKPNLPEEKKRIEKAGGRVVFDGFYNHRVFAHDGMYPGLNMSRALGDVAGHRAAGLSADPDIKEVPLGTPRLLLLCTDGVWEFIESSEAMSRMTGGKDPRRLESTEMKESLGNLTKDSYDRWMKDSDNEISDDITGIAVCL